MSEMQPGLISVMMPAYNAATYIEQAIRSVLPQTYPDWELLIVNDGSSDTTSSIARSIVDPRIRVFDKTNGGESSARNVALDHARGEFVAFLDADDAYEPEHLETAIRHLRAHPEYDAVYTDGTHIDEHGVRMTSLQSRRRGPFQGRIYEEVIRASDVFGPPGCVVLRHDLVAASGLRFDPRIVIGPDWDFFIRYADRATFAPLADRTYLYRVHQTNITAQIDQTKRAGFLTICREKAIGMASFRACSVETRAAVFYDLLINLLRGHDDRRALMLESGPFRTLPASEQARLLRLTAAEATLEGDPDAATISIWLDRAASLEPWDWRARVLAWLHGMSPALCRGFLRAIAPARGSTQPTAPFADLEPARLNASRDRRP
jgi:glycosyltransferase involved in cell wall biosynthesis